MHADKSFGTLGGRRKRGHRNRGCVACENHFGRVGIGFAQDGEFQVQALGHCLDGKIRARERGHIGGWMQVFAVRRAFRIR